MLDFSVANIRFATLAKYAKALFTKIMEDEIYGKPENGSCFKRDGSLVG